MRFVDIVLDKLPGPRGGEFGDSSRRSSGYTAEFKRRRGECYRCGAVVGKKSMIDNGHHTPTGGWCVPVKGYEEKKPIVLDDGTRLATGDLFEES